MNFNPCREIKLSSLDELLDRLRGRLHEGSFWTRAEWLADGSRYDLHFTVLNVSVNVNESKLLVHDGNYAGHIMTLIEFEVAQSFGRSKIVSYWPVMQDELHRVRFSSSR